jgi:hypothetical protein
MPENSYKNGPRSARPRKKPRPSKRLASGKHGMLGRMDLPGGKHSPCEERMRPNSEEVMERHIQGAMQSAEIHEV